MSWLYLLTVPVVYGLGLWMAIHVIMKGRTSQGTIAWVFALLLVPWLALPLYMVFGDRKFVGYVRAGKQGTRPIDQIARQLAESLVPFVAVPWKDDAADRAFARLARLPFTRGNRVELLIDGQATFDAIIEAIALATNYVVVQFYIFRDDGVGKRLREALLAARSRGVRVFLMYDELGSLTLPEAYLKGLVDAGCECTGFRTKSRRRRMFRINFRNHRKSVICDGRVAFVGGHNVGDEYLGLHKKLQPWRDTHVAIRGPAVQGVQLAFAEDWYWAKECVPELDWLPRACDGGDMHVVIVPNGPADDLETGSLLFTQVMDSARSRLWSATPYFVPGEEVTAALQLGALRGVDVKVIIPEMADSEPPRLSAFTYFNELMPAGVKIYRYQKGFMHQKVVLSDDVACIGTVNMDNRSLRLNFEMTVVVVDAAFAAEVAKMLELDLGNSLLVGKKDFDERSFWFRFRCRVSRLMAPIQ